MRDGKRKQGAKMAIAIALWQCGELRMEITRDAVGRGVHADASSQEHRLVLLQTLLHGCEQGCVHERDVVPAVRLSAMYRQDCIAMQALVLVIDELRRAQQAAKRGWLGHMRFLDERD